MKFIVKWGVYFRPNVDVITTLTDNKEEIFHNYEEAKRFKEKLVKNCVELGTSFYTKPIIEVRD